MGSLLIVEDQPSDARIAAELFRSMGISGVNARASASAARLYLEEALDGECEIPNVIILDLDLGYESGFELLRFWHSTPELSSAAHMIVWTALGEEQQEICRLFKVDAVVPKGEGVSALRKAIEPFAAAAS
jgi:CheY-like chemotaxis protein